MDALRRFHEILLRAGLAPPPWEAWSAYAAENAELWPIMRGPLMIGGVFFKGQTVHIAVLPEWHGRWVSKTMRRGYDCWTHECAIETCIKPDNRAAVVLARRLGFHFTGRNQGPHHIYRKEPNHEIQPN
jgi:GNAT superfamily N-acetyltransferase